MKFTSVIAATLSFSSALAAPAPPKKPVSAGTSPIASVLQVVSGLKTTVKSDLAFVQTTVTSGVTADLVPGIKTKLTSVVTGTETAVGQLAPLLLSIALPVAEGELSSVLAVVNEAKAIVSCIQTNLQSLVGSVASEVLITAVGEVNSVLAVVNPFINPIIALSYGVVGSTNSHGGPTAMASEILGVVTELKGIAGSLIAPLTGVLGPATGALAPVTGALAPVTGVVGPIAGGILKE